MLILTRKVGEKLIINNNIEVTILEIKGSQIRIGIDAPRDVSIFREEIFNKLNKEEVKVQEVKSP